MKLFPYDEFYPVFMQEVKSLFSRFISLNKDKKPYIFTICVPDYIAYHHTKSYCLWANGNTIVDFESHGNTFWAKISPKLRNEIANFKSEGTPLGDSLGKIMSKAVDSGSDGYSYANTTNEVALVYKYSADEWNNEAFTDNDFSKSNSIIQDYVIENRDMIEEKDYQFTEGFKVFRTEFFSFLIKCLKQLRDEKFFDSVYPERVLINFEVREYYENEEMVRIFECLNTKEETELFAEWILPNWGQLTKRKFEHVKP